MPTNRIMSPEKWTNKEPQESDAVNMGLPQPYKIINEKDREFFEIFFDHEGNKYTQASIPKRVLIGNINLNDITQDGIYTFNKDENNALSIVYGKYGENGVEQVDLSELYGEDFFPQNTILTVISQKQEYDSFKYTIQEITNIDPQKVFRRLISSEDANIAFKELTNIDVIPYTDVYSENEVLTNKLWFGKKVYRKCFPATLNVGNDFQLSVEVPELNVKECPYIYALMDGKIFTNGCDIDLKNGGIIEKTKFSANYDESKNQVYFQYIKTQSVYNTNTEEYTDTTIDIGEKNIMVVFEYTKNNDVPEKLIQFKLKAPNELWNLTDYYEGFANIVFSNVGFSYNGQEFRLSDSVDFTNDSQGIINYSQALFNLLTNIPFVKDVSNIENTGTFGGIFATITIDVNQLPDTEEKIWFGDISDTELLTHYLRIQKHSDTNTIQMGYYYPSNSGYPEVMSHYITDMSGNDIFWETNPSIDSLT